MSRHAVLALLCLALGCPSSESDPSTASDAAHAGSGGSSAENGGAGAAGNASSGTGDAGTTGSTSGTGSHASGDLEGPFTSFAARPCPDDSPLTYESFGAPFFLDWCQGCHGAARAEGQRQNAPLTVRFDDVAAIRAQAEKIWLRAADQNTSMPPVGGPSAEQRRLLGEWLACGAPSRADR